MGCSIPLPNLIQILDAEVLKVKLPDAQSPDTQSNSQVLSSLIIYGVSTDSRTLKPGEAFVALEGSSFDGHGFLQQAVRGGAIALIVRYLPQNIDADELQVPVLQVANTLVAYQRIAHWWRKTLKTTVVAITGSVGKTTTKELVATVLGHYGKVLKTQANYNNEIGVPKTLLELDPSHDYAVVEMGMRGPGEIAELAQIAVPDIGLITNVGTAHIGRLGSRDAIAQAKCELLDHLPAHGIAVLNQDNPRLLDAAHHVWQGTTVTYGLMGGDIHGTLHDSGQMSVNGLANTAVEFPVPLAGQHNALNYLAALTVTKVLSLDWTRLTQGITVTLPSGRAYRHVLANDIVVLDETYNAGFESMTASLRLLASIPGRRHIAVLGTMKELGDWSIALHRDVGGLVDSLGVDHLFILADPDESQALATGAASIPSRQCQTHDELLHALKTEVKAGDRILFKASRSVGLDQVVEQFCRSLPKDKITPPSRFSSLG